jgi:MYXO-CTERM domain-containing protein
VSIDEPTDGSAFAYEDDWHLVITLQDDRTPQVLHTSIFFDDNEVIADQQFLNTTLDCPINGGDPPMGHGLSSGAHTIRVEITDEGGNPASTEVEIEIMGGPASADTSGGAGTSGGNPEDSSGGDEDPGTDGGTSVTATGPMMGGDDGGGCNCDIDRNDTRALPLFAAMLVLARRRRTRAA